MTISIEELVEKYEDTTAAIVHLVYEFEATNPTSEQMGLFKQMMEIHAVESYQSNNSLNEVFAELDCTRNALDAIESKVKRREIATAVTQMTILQHVIN